MAGQDRARLLAPAVAITSFTIAGAGLKALAVASSFRRELIFAAAVAPTSGLWMWHRAFHLSS